MFMGIWSAAIGLVFGWCAMLISADKDMVLWARTAISAAVGMTAAFLFDFVAFENANTAFALGGGAAGGAISALVHQLVASGLERRPARKPEAHPRQSL